MVDESFIFQPTPNAAAGILADLDDPSLSFDDLARKHGTTTEALALWLSTDPVKERIQTSLDAMAFRIRKLATGRLPAAMRVICHIVESYDGRQDQPLDPTSPDYRVERERRRRRDESTRRAATLLLRLANFFSPLVRPRERLARVAASPEPAEDVSATTVPAPAMNQAAVIAPSPSAPSALNSPPKTNGAATVRERTPSNDTTTPANTPEPSHAVHPGSMSTVHFPRRGGSTFSPSISLYDLLPSPPPPSLTHLFGPRGPAYVMSRAGACVGAAP